MFCSPARSRTEQSSSEDLLSSDAMESGTPPKAPSPKYMNNAEASSQKDPGQGGEEEIVKAAPGGQTSGAGDMGEKIPMGVVSGGHLEFGSPPDAIPETNMAPASSRRPPSAGGGVPVPSATSVQPEVALKNASIVDEHRALMGAVIEKIQSTESGLNEACISLIRGFEVCVMSFRRVS